jgi:transcriptional regulator of arginine metabolism
VLSRHDRLQLIQEILADGPVPSQADLRELLAERGAEVTQATLSRDLRDLGVVKAPEGYRPPIGSGAVTDTPLARSLRDFASSVDAVGQLVVVRTGPGQAQLVAACLDESPPPHAAGTIAGDDTIFVACTSVSNAQGVASHLARLSGLAVGAAG